MKKQYLILAIGVVAVSLAVIFIRLAEAPPLVIAAWRMSLAALIMIPLAMFHSREEFSRLSGTDIGLSLTAGLFLALHFGLWTASLSYTTVAPQSSSSPPIPFLSQSLLTCSSRNASPGKS